MEKPITFEYYKPDLPEEVDSSLEYTQSVGTRQRYVPQPSRKDIRLLYKVIEALVARISSLEQCADKSKLKPLGRHTSTLKDINGLIQRPSPRTSTTFKCPLTKCSRKLQRRRYLHQHIRSTLEHEFLKKIIDETYCLQCNRDFTDGKALANHDNAHHNESSFSRIDSFAPFFGNILPTSTPETEQHDQLRNDFGHEIGSDSDSYMDDGLSVGLNDHPKLGVDQPAAASTSPAAASINPHNALSILATVSSPNLSRQLSGPTPVTGLSTNSNAANRDTRYDNSFVLPVDSNSDLAKHPTSDLLIQQADLDRWAQGAFVTTPGSSFNVAANSSNDPARHPIPTITQASQSNNIEGQMQDLGYDIPLCFLDNSSGDPAGYPIPTVTQASQSNNIEGQMQDLGYDIPPCFLDSSCGDPAGYSIPTVTQASQSNNIEGQMQDLGYDIPPCFLDNSCGDPAGYSIPTVTQASQSNNIEGQMQGLDYGCPISFLGIPVASNR